MQEWRRVLEGLGIVLVVVAGWSAYLTIASGDPILKAVIDGTLIAGAGAVLLVTGWQLPRADIDPAHYRRIVAWVFTGLAVMFVFVLARTLHPGVSVEHALGTQAIAVSLGSLFGLLIGIRETQVLTYTLRLEAQNDALRRAKVVEEYNNKLKETQRQLEDANLKLEQSNERLEGFAYAASHDLREPLRMVSSYLRLLEARYADALDDDGREFVAFAVDGADRMRLMIESLLEYARVETGSRPFDVVDLDDVLEDTMTDLQVRISETGAVVTSGSLPTVVGDAGQLGRVLQNLVSNAIEYSDGEPTVHISASEDDETWTITVRDDGIGIDPEEQERIFNIFERLHAVGERDGSGIGLALCKRIVERHGGDIWVDSTPGEGSTFSFSISKTHRGLVDTVPTSSSVGASSPSDPDTPLDRSAGNPLDRSAGNPLDCSTEDPPSLD